MKFIETNNNNSINSINSSDMKLLIKLLRNKAESREKINTSADSYLPNDSKVPVLLMLLKGRGNE